jgi:hypothetical protein
MVISKYQPAPPGARPGSKAGAPGSTSSYVPSNPVVPMAPGAAGSEPIDIAAAVAEAVGGLDLSGGIDWGAYGGGGSGSGGAPKSYYDALGAARTSEAKTAGAKFALDALKYENELSTDAAALARKKAAAQSQLEYLKGQLTGGEINPELARSLEEQRAQREGYVNDEYKRLLGNLGTQYGQAQTLTTEGFDALKSYLQGAPQNAYQTAIEQNPATAAPMANDLAQYMASRGVEAGRTEPGLLAANAAAQGGAANYNNLLTVLAATSTQAQQSRLNEQAMAQRLADAQLTARKAAQEGTLTTAQLQGLQTIQDQYNAAKIQLQANAIARDQALQDAIASVTGSGALEYTPLVVDTTKDGGANTGGAADTGGAAAVTKSKAVQMLANQVAAAKGSNAKALQARADKFIAANPTATPKEIKDEFPKLRAAAVKATAKKK